MTADSPDTVVAPVAGRIIDITEIPDPVFAGKSMGEGFGILDTPGGDVVAPVSGKVMMVAKTGHAVGITTASGLQYLVHLGIDTVELEGRPFTITVSKGDEVTAGEKIGTMDNAVIEEAGKSTATVVIVTNTKKKLDSLDVDYGDADLGQEVARAHPKVAAAPKPAAENAPDAVVAPVAGRIIDITEIPDPVFAGKSMGEGFGILDTPGGDVVAPVSGKVMMVAKTGHAVGITTASGLQYLVHLGIDTVELEGRPFTITVSKGDEVTAGEKIGTMDNAVIEEAGKSTATVVIVTNTKKKLDSLDVDYGDADLGQEVARGTAKVKDPAPAAAEAEPSSEPSSEVATVGDGGVAKQRPAELTGFDALAWDIIDNIGGAENVRSVTHCITRVRFYLKDEGKADDAVVADLDGVIDVVKAGGQYQVVIGPEVENVYNAIEAQLGPTDDAPEDVREKPTTAVGWVKYGFSELIGVITGSMIPIIGLLAASGIIKGILSLLLTFDVITDDSNTFQIINAMSDAVFFFLPIFVGFTAARRLGADPIIVAIIGGVLTYPTLVEMSNSGADSNILGMPLNSDFFGIPFHMASYSYSIFPIIVAAWVASIVEPWLKKVIPAILRMIFVPLLEVIIVSVVILMVLGPVVMFISTGIATTIQALYDLSPTISGAVIGAFYQSLVIFGLHWAVIPLVAQDIAASGNSYLNAIISSTMVAQGGAVLAVFIKTKLEKIKSLSGPAAISAFCGITEPAMYGVNLKYGRVFIMASIGGFVGGLLTGLFNVNMWGFTGSLIGFTSFVNPDGLDFSFWGFLIASAAALGTAFVLTWFFGFKDSDVEAERTVKKVRLGRRDPVAK